jgi:hypothetical protein
VLKALRRIRRDSGLSQESLAWEVNRSYRPRSRPEPANNVASLDERRSRHESERTDDLRCRALASVEAEARMARQRSGVLNRRSPSPQD